MRDMKNFMMFIVGCVSIYLAYITGTGEILNYVPFADPLNEMAFFMLTAGFGIISIVASVTGLFTKA